MYTDYLYLIPLFHDNFCVDKITPKNWYSDEKYIPKNIRLTFESFCLDRVVSSDSFPWLDIFVYYSPWHQDLNVICIQLPQH